MKRLLLTLMSAVALTCTALAQTFQVGDLSYTVSSSALGQVTCVGLSSTGKGKTNLDLTIPAMVTYSGNAYSVTQIGEAAFKGETNLVGVNMQYGIKKIKSEAFRGSSNLLYARVPSSVEDLGSESFAGCTKLDYFYIAHLVPSQVATYRSAFDSSTTRSLLVPWTASFDDYRDRAAFNKSNFPKIVHSGYSYDFYMDNGSMSIVTKPSTSTDVPHEVTVIGFNKYGGNAGVSEGKFKLREIDTPNGFDRSIKYVAVADSAFAGNDILTEVDLSAARSITRIGECSFRGCPNLTSVKLSADTIGRFAFMDCSKLATAQWDERLTRIEREAFGGAPITNDLVLPVGLKHLGFEVFRDVKSKFLLVPSTLLTCDLSAFAGMSSLKTLVVNTPDAFKSTWTLYFTDVPTSCNVYVPVGQLNKAKTHVDWKHFTTIKEGAYDFWFNGENSYYKMTVTSTTPFTLDGVDYAGKAKYVYNERLPYADNFRPDNSETNNMVGQDRVYLMTEVGDSIFCNSNIKKFDFARMTQLERIGRKAFMNSQLESATMPVNNNKIKFGIGAFVDAKQLRELVIPSEKGFSWEGKFYGNNHDDFNCFVHYIYGISLNQTNFSNFDYDDYGYYTCYDYVGVCFTPQGNTFNLGGLPFEFTKSGLNAYEVRGVDNATGKLKTQKVSYTEEGSGGVIITDLTPGELVKVRRNVGADYQDYNSNLLQYAASTLNLNTKENSYYWDFINNRFVRVTGSHTIDSMRSYLVMAGNVPFYELDILPSTAATGDVNGDGTVDVTDVNLAINVMLGKATKAQYPAADVNGDGTVDVTDVNLIINAMLGK